MGTQDESRITRKYRHVGIGKNYENMSNCKSASLDNAPSFLRKMLQEIEFTSMKCSFSAMFAKHTQKMLEVTF